MNDFRYIPENEIVGGILGCTPSPGTLNVSAAYTLQTWQKLRIVKLMITQEIVGVDDTQIDGIALENSTPVFFPQIQIDTDTDTAIQIYSYKCINIYSNRYIHIYRYTAIQLYIYTDIHLYRYTDIQIYIYTYIQLYSYTAIQLYSYIYIYSYSYISVFIIVIDEPSEN